MHYADVKPVDGWTRGDDRVPGDPRRDALVLQERVEPVRTDDGLASLRLYLDSFLTFRSKNPIKSSRNEWKVVYSVLVVRRSE